MATQSSFNPVAHNSLICPLGLVSQLGPGLTADSDAGCHLALRQEAGSDSPVSHNLRLANSPILAWHLTASHESLRIGIVHMAERRVGKPWPLVPES